MRHLPVNVAACVSKSCLRLLLFYGRQYSMQPILWTIHRIQLKQKSGRKAGLVWSMIIVCGEDTGDADCMLCEWMTLLQVTAARSSFWVALNASRLQRVKTRMKKKHRRLLRESCCTRSLRNQSINRSKHAVSKALYRICGQANERRLADKRKASCACPLHGECETVQTAVCVLM